MKMTTEVSPENQKLANELFELFDKDGNGVLSIQELEKGLCASGRNPDKNEMKQILKDMNIKDGQPISREVFAKTVALYSRPKSAEEMKRELSEAFKIFDKNNNGFLERRELAFALKRLGEKLTDAELKQMFDEADKNKDGKIAYKEFIDMFTKGAKEVSPVSKKTVSVAKKK